jgi:peptidyl-prolyl cis-trans isomerase C
MKAMGKLGVAGRPAWAAATLLAVTLLLAACDHAGLPDQPPQPGDRAVARVNGRTVWASDVQREAVAQGLIREGSPLDPSSDLFRQMLDEVVDQKLLASEALRRQLDRDPMVQRRLAAARERILGDMLVERVVAGAVNENAIRGLYDEQVRLAHQSEEFRARQIVVASQPEATQVRQLLAGGAAFETLAMDRSTDTETKYNGGDMGYFTADVMPEAYGAALQAAHVGDLIGPFQTDQGWVVMKLEDRRPEQPITLAAARPQIIRFLTYDQVRDLLERLRSSAHVQTLIGPAPQVPGSPREPASAPRLIRPVTPPSSLPAQSSTAGPGTASPAPAPPAPLPPAANAPASAPTTNAAGARR